MIDRENEQVVEGVNHAIDLLAQALGVTDWVGQDGSEDFDTDVSNTLLNILAAKGLYDADECRFAALKPDVALPNLARQFDLMAKGCRSMGLESLEGDYDALRQDANAGKIDAAPIVEAIDYDYRNGHDGKAAAELLVGALLKDALHA